MRTKELFEKVYIKSEDDLPKQAGSFTVYEKSGEVFENFLYPEVDNIFVDAKMWLSHIVWYLLPAKNETADNTKELLDDIISWEKDLSEYRSLEGILRERYIITKRQD